MEKISHQQPKPSFIKRLIPIVLIIVVILALLQVMKGMKTEPAKIPEKPQGFLVETAKVNPSNLTLQIQSQGILMPKRQIALLTEISGKVVSMSPAFTAGGTFEQGDLLVQIDPADYQVAVARAEASLASAQAQVDLDQAKSDQALKDWQSFGKPGKPSDLLLNIPQLDGAKASLRAAKADLMKAKRDLEKTEIKAPFAGTVISKSVDLGQFIGMSASLGSIAGTDVAEVRLPLSNEQIKQLNLQNLNLNDSPLYVEFTQDLNQLPILGQIRRLESSKDSRTLMTYAVAEIDQPFADGLRFNSYLQAQIFGQSYDQIFSIPTAWMMPNNQLSIYNDSGTLEIKSVQVIHKTNDFFYVNQGLTSQDQIIITPIQAPEEGMQLRLKPMEVESDKKAFEANQASVAPEAKS